MMRREGVDRIVILFKIFGPQMAILFHSHLKIDVYGISFVKLELISIHGVFLLPHTELIDN